MTIYYPNEGGSAHSNCELARGLSERGYDVDVIAQLDKRCQDYDKWSMETLDIPIYRTPVEEGYAGNPPTEEYLRTINKFIAEFLGKKNLSGDMPDLVVLGFDPWTYHEEVVHGFGLPVVQHIKGTPTRAIKDGIYPQRDADEFIEHLCRADHIIPVADHFKRLIVSFNYPTEQITTINDGVDVCMFKPSSPNIELMNELEIPKNKNVIVHASNMWPVKRVCDIVESANRVLERRDDIMYLFVGEGPDTDKLKEAVSKSPHKEHFRLKGWIPHSEVPDYMNLGGVFILSSESEGYPRVAMEAQACGLHLIASDMPAGRECTLNGKIGTNYRMGDVNDLAEKTLSVLEMEKRLFSEIQSKAMNFITSECSFDAQLSRYIECLEDTYERCSALKSVISIA